MTADGFHRLVFHSCVWSSAILYFVLSIRKLQISWKAIAGFGGLLFGGLAFTGVVLGYADFFFGIREAVGIALFYLLSRMSSQFHSEYSSYQNATRPDEQVEYLKGWIKLMVRSSLTIVFGFLALTMAGLARRLFST